MKTLPLDLGIEEFALGGGVLRFNPRDPNVYARLMGAGEKFISIEKGMEDPNDPTTALDADQRMKEALGWIFGPGNDFDAIFQGVNVMSIGENGERVITNFLAAITPIVAEGARLCALTEVTKAKQSRPGAKK